MTPKELANWIKHGDLPNYMAKSINHGQIVVRWIPKEKPKGWKKWMGLALLQEGRWFVSPAIAGMSEYDALLCCCYDGAPVIDFGKIRLVSAVWLQQEKPECRDLVETFITVSSWGATEIYKQAIKAAIYAVENGGDPAADMAEVLFTEGATPDLRHETYWHLNELIEEEALRADFEADRPPCYEDQIKAGDLSFLSAWHSAVRTADLCFSDEENALKREREMSGSLRTD